MRAITIDLSRVITERDAPNLRWREQPRPQTGRREGVNQQALFNSQPFRKQEVVHISLLAPIFFLFRGKLQRHRIQAQHL